MDSIRTVTSNKILDAVIPIGGIKALEDEEGMVGKLHIVERKRDHNRNIVVNAELMI